MKDFKREADFHWRHTVNMKICKWFHRKYWTEDFYEPYGGFYTCEKCGLNWRLDE